MARPFPHPGTTPDLKTLHDWAVKVTQWARERFAPQDTIPEIAPVIPEETVTGMVMLFLGAVPPTGWVLADAAVGTANPAPGGYIWIVKS